MLYTNHHEFIEPQQTNPSTFEGRRYALCVGIGIYTNLNNRHLRYAVSDAQAIAEKLQDIQRGQFEVTLLREPIQTTKNALEKALDYMLNGQHLNENDLVVIYFSCHGDMYLRSNTFFLLPSDTFLLDEGIPQKTTVIDIHDLAKTLTGARVKNIIFLLDACYSGGVGKTFQHLSLDRDLAPGTNIFMIGAARHDQVALQSSHVKHGVFTSCLLRAFEQKPRRNDGWLTIYDIYSFIAEELTASEQGRRVQIQGVSAAVDPNILFIKNPHYSAQSPEFAKAVQELLQLMQYEPVRMNELQGAPANFYIAEIKSGLHVNKVGIIPYNNQVQPLTSEYVEHIATFIKAEIELENLDRGLLVTKFDVSNKVKQCVKTRFLEIRSYESIWRNLIDFKKYLRKLISNYETAPQGTDSAPLSQIYIPLNAEYRAYEVSDHNHSKMIRGHELPSRVKKRIEDRLGKGYKIDSFGKGYKIKWEGDAESTVRHWLIDSKSSRLALLADYGSGKTTLCQHMAAMLAKELLDADNRQAETRHPLLIPLLDFSKVPVDLEGYLVSYLKRYCYVDNPDFAALMRMAEAGLLFFMLDGFDELASRATVDTIQQNMALFEKLASLPKNKVLLTTRPEYFISVSQELSILHSYDSLHLQLFNKEQINLYLQKRAPLITHHASEHIKNWMYYRDQINKIHDLSDLANRPVLLEMIIKTLPVLISQDETINHSNLYQRYLEGELDRQHIVKHRQDLQISRQKRFEIMEQIALELYITNRVELTSNQILEVSRQLLTSEQREEIEKSLREILTCSFLVRIDNMYRFSHQSFFEYLVARCLAKDIIADFVGTFRLKLISEGILGFLIELERSFQHRNTNAINLSIENATFDFVKLMDWFDVYAKDANVRKNAVALLARLLTPMRFRKLSLTDVDLSGVNLSGMDLSGMDLSSTDLSDTDLIGAKLCKANLSRANLRLAKLNQADLSSAILGRAILDKANLSQANLSSAYLVGANLRVANLDGANLKGADLRGADLSGANLKGVDLDGIDTSLTKLTGAVLD